MAGKNPFDNTGGGTATKTRPGLSVANGKEAPTTARPRDPFAVATSGNTTDYKVSDFLDELLLVEPIEVDEMVTSASNGQLQEFVRVNVIRLDNENERVENMLVFQVALVSSLKRVLRGENDWVLGRLQLGQAKGGKNAPYLLNPPNEDDIDLAKEVMAQLGLI